MSELELMRKRERERERERKKEGGGFSSFSSLKDRADHSVFPQWRRRLRRKAPKTFLFLFSFSISLTHSLSLQVITPFRRLILCAENRKEMEDWISSLKSVQSREHYEVRILFLINIWTDPYELCSGVSCCFVDIPTCKCKCKCTL